MAGEKRKRREGGGASIVECGQKKACATQSSASSMRRPLKELIPRASVEEKVAPGSADGAKPAAAAKNRMPKDHVKWILTQKPLATLFRYAALKQSNPDLTPRPGEEVDEERSRLYFFAKKFYEMEEEFPKLQEFVLGELKTKGYVEVSDEWIRDMMDLNEIAEREWPKIQAKIEEIVSKQTSQCGDDEDDCYDYEED